MAFVIESESWDYSDDERFRFVNTCQLLQIFIFDKHRQWFVFSAR